MAIVYTYAVKHNGKYYPPNTPIEEEPSAASTPKETVTGNQEATRGDERGKKAEGGLNTQETKEPAKKATRGRKKGDAT